MRSKAVLLPGVKVTLNVETAKETKKRTWNYPDGMKGYLAELIGKASAVAPVFDGEKYVKEGEANGFAVGEGAAWAFAFVEDDKGYGESYANLIPTSDGGTHEAGLREGIFEAIKAFAEYHNLTPKGVKLLAEDAWSRTVYFLSAKVLEPQFHGQTKEKLSNRDAVKLVAEMVRDPFALWMNSNVEHGQQDRRPGHPAGDRALAHGAEGRAQKVLERGDAAGEADRLRVERPQGQRAVPGRGRLGGRLGQAGAQQALPGDLPHARQGAQLLGGEARAAVLQRRDPRHRGGARRRSRTTRRTTRTSRACATARWPR